MTKYFDSGIPFDNHRMNLNIPGTYMRGISIDYPNYCPYENSGTSYKIIYNSNVHDLTYKKATTNGNIKINGYMIACMFKCLSCHKFSAIEYRSDSNNRLNFYPVTYTLNNITFTSPFGDDTNLISEFDPMFMKIYKQASLTEQLGYGEVFPIAYRRAFESLVKTTLIKQFHCKENSVIKAKLSSNYKELMKKSQELGNEALFTTWLGNDYAHFHKIDPEISTPDCKILKHRIGTFVKMISIMKTTETDEKYIKRGKD